MKKLLFLGSFLLMLGVSNAQVELWLGPKAGVNIANVSEVEADALIGANLGAAFMVKFNKRYALQPELGLSMQGSKKVGGSNENLKLDYFTVGVINKLYFVEGFHMLAGPEFNFKVNDTFSDFSYDDDNDEWDFDDEGIQPFDFAIVAGLGYDFPFGLSIDARYKQGLMDINDFFGFGEDDNNLNHAFQIGLSYKFHLNK